MNDDIYELLNKNKDVKLESIPFKSRTPELCLAAMRRDVTEFRHTPDSLKTPEICLAAVQRLASLLEYVPVSLRTPVVCIAAVRQERHGKSLSLVPDKNKNYDFYMKVFTSREYDWKDHDILDNGFPDLRAIGALRTETDDADSYILSHVRDEWKTPELCMAAVKFDGAQLRFVPDELRTKEVCYAAVESNPCALAFIPESEKTNQLFLAAIKSHTYAIEIIPRQYLTEEMCNTAVNKRGTNLKLFPAN